MKTKLIFILTTLCAPGFALANARHTKDHHVTWKERMGSNSLSNSPRHADSPDVVVVPPTGGTSSGAMSTAPDSSGNGMARREHFDLYGSRKLHEGDWTDPSASRGNRVHRDDADDYTADTATDTTVYHSASSSAGSVDNDSGHFVFYGDDIPAFKGLQLEMALNRLHHINLKEIELAKLAESRAKSADVLNYAHQLRHDHEILEDKVTKLANKRDITLASFQPATYEKSLRSRLEKLNGADFETAFLRVMERGHAETAREMRMVRNDLGDTEVRTLINEALPSITAHRNVPQQIDKARAGIEEDDIGE